MAVDREFVYIVLAPWPSNVDPMLPRSTCDITPAPRRPGCAVSLLANSNSAQSAVKSNVKFETSSFQFRLGLPGRRSGA